MRGDGGVNSSEAAPQTARRLILYSPILRVSVFRCMPKASAVLVRLPSHRPSTRLMKRFSNSRTASSNCTPFSTISSTSRSSRSLIMRRRSWPGSWQLSACQASERLDVLFPRPFHHVRRQRGHRRLLVPVDALEVVADELLVKARLWAARSIAIERPEPRGVRGQRLVDQDHPLLRGSAIVGQKPEFELGVGDDDATRFGVG